MTFSRCAIVSIALGINLTLAACSPTSPTPSPSRPKPTAKVGVTVSNVTRATIEPEKFSYTFRLQLTERGGVPSTVTEVVFAFDDGWGYWAHITGDDLGQNRRLAANGTLDLELTSIPEWGYKVGNEVSNADVEVFLTDDNGNSVRAVAFIDKL